MDGIALVFGLVLLGIGCAGIFFVTIPSIYGIAEGAAETAQGAVELSKGEENTNKVVNGVGKAVLSGIVLWITTGILIALVIFGVILTIFGFVD